MPRNDETPLEKLLTPQELADLLGVPIKTLYQWRYQSNGPTGIRVGRHVRYRPVDVRRWLEAQ